MKRQLLLAEFASTPWAIMPDRLSLLTSVMLRWAAGVDAAEDVMSGVRADAATVDARREQSSARTSGGAIAVIPVYGVITRRQTASDVSGSGTTSTQALSSALRAAMADETVSGVILDIDSEGGSCAGTQEFADEVFAARSQKPIYAIANSLAASAAYWIGSQATKMFVSPSGQVGSIGVLAVHTDVSKALEAEGVKKTFITAGKFKSEGNPTEPLSAEARDYLQTMVDAFYTTFTKAVAKGRGAPIGQVRDGMGQGRVLLAGDAQAAGMVDGVATFNDVVGLMARDLRASRQPAARAAARARDLEINGA